MRLCLGKIAAAHGIKGLVKLEVYAQDPAALQKYGPLYTAESGGRMLSLSLKNRAGQHWLAEIEGVADRTVAETLRGTLLWLPRAALPETKSPHEYYYADLAGLAAFAPDGTPRGTVIGVENFGAGDILEIRPPSGESYYVAFTSANVPSIDIAQRRMVLAYEDSSPDPASDEDGNE